MSKAMGEGNYKHVLIFLTKLFPFAFRNLCIDLLNLCGMRDLHKHMEQELDSWEVWHLDEKERSTELRKMAQAWLDKYAVYLLGEEI